MYSYETLTIYVQITASNPCTNGSGPVNDNRPVNKPSFVATPSNHSRRPYAGTVPLSHSKAQVTVRQLPARNESTDHGSHFVFLALSTTEAPTTEVSV